MITVLILSIFFIFYGILGLFGIQNIPEVYLDTEFAKSYKRFSGIGWLLLGIPYLVVWIVTHNMGLPPLTIVLILLACGIPSLIFTCIGSIKFGKWRKAQNK